jgi:predicted dithiol-disulfide oxidoreductase (DUF899 family)
MACRRCTTCAEGGGSPDDFDADFGVSEWHGTNAFIRDGNRIFRTYFVNDRGDEAMVGTWSYLDLTALGRRAGFRKIIARRGNRPQVAVDTVAIR